jgi:hypothetical protein
MIAQLHADREVKASGAAAEASNLHAMPPSCSNVRDDAESCEIFQA